MIKKLERPEPHCRVDIVLYDVVDKLNEVIEAVNILASVHPKAFSDYYEVRAKHPQIKL